MLVNRILMQPSSHQEIIIAIIAGSLMLVLLGCFILTFVFFYKKRRIAHLSEKQAIQARFEKELLRTQLEIQEHTLKTISQEIHDNIGQVLTLAKLNLNTVDLIASENSLTKVHDTKDLITKAIKDLRDLSRTLNTDTISANGLIASIETEVSMIQKTGIIHASFENKGIPIYFDSQKELIVFRVIQECLHNILKHAQATKLTVSVHFDDTEMRIIIADNGKGFNMEGIKSTGSGLHNIRSRTALIGAFVEIKSFPGAGTSVELKLAVG